MASGCNGSLLAKTKKLCDDQQWHGCAGQALACDLPFGIALTGEDSYADRVNQRLLIAEKFVSIGVRHTFKRP